MAASKALRRSPPLKSRWAEPSFLDKSVNSDDDPRDRFSRHDGGPINPDVEKPNEPESRGFPGFFAA
jgi:hypothetical protein